ncbi:hypothetical protein GCM10009837_44910 [Streptomyces durmitorensis]|uniref:Uncharacterized protein n=1 Tax=Streptomyces durmitorensis TaxID=319947 RepID=A0ABY4Q5S6_9ACTN|nr:hypothetical protein [Streptomyces durmitorensis]UQT60516.1 hypothetical protein M4V62_38635 [Streptomyces durmitorensis]
MRARPMAASAVPATPALPTTKRTPRTSQRILPRLVVLFLLPLLTTLSGTLLAPAHAHADALVRHAPSATTLLAPPPAPDEPCTSKDAAVCLIRQMSPEEREQAREVRLRYHRLLDTMERVADRMHEEGRSDEEIARVLVDMRNEAKDITRAGMSPEAVQALEARNMKKYGNPLGPTADQQFAKYGSWAKVIEAATRTSAAVDQELGIPPRV